MTETPQERIAGMTLEDQLKLYKKDVENRRAAYESTQKLNAPDIDEQAASRSFLDQFAARESLTVDYADSTATKLVADQMRLYYNDLSLGLFGHRGNFFIDSALEGKVKQIPAGKFGKFMDQVPVIEPGHERYDLVAKQEKKVRGLRENMEKLQEGKLDMKVLQEDAKKQLKDSVEKAFSVEKDPQHGYLTDDFKKATQAVIDYYSQSPEYAQRMFLQKFGAENDKLKKMFTDDADKDKYVAEKLKAMNNKGGADREQAMEIFYGIYTAK